MTFDDLGQGGLEAGHGAPLMTFECPMLRAERRTRCRSPRSRSRSWTGRAPRTLTHPGRRQRPRQGQLSSCGRHLRQVHVRRLAHRRAQLALQRHGRHLPEARVIRDRQGSRSTRVSIVLQDVRCEPRNAPDSEGVGRVPRRSPVGAQVHGGLSGVLTKTNSDHTPSLSCTNTRRCNARMQQN